MLLNEYLKAVDNLTINKTSHSQMNEEMVRNQQALAAEIQAKDQEMHALRNEILETKAAQQKKEDDMQVLKEQIEEIRYLYQDLIQRNTFVRNLNEHEVEIE
jgi:predicted  nucleic acid-binding Zn-ribbon protein